MRPVITRKQVFENVHPFYSKMMTQKLFKAFVYPYKNTWNAVASVEKVLTTKTLQEFQTNLL